MSINECLFVFYARYGTIDGYLSGSLGKNAAKEICRWYPPIRSVSSCEESEKLEVESTFKHFAPAHPLLFFLGKNCLMISDLSGLNQIIVMQCLIMLNHKEVFKRVAKASFQWIAIIGNLIRQQRPMKKVPFQRFHLVLGDAHTKTASCAKRLKTGT